MKGPADPGHAELRHRLRGLRVEPEDAGFNASLHRRLAEAGPPGARPASPRARLSAAVRHLLWPALGFAAFAAAVIVLVATPGGPPRSSLDDGVARVPATRVALVHLNLSVDAAVAAADIRVSLPEGLVFWVDGAAAAERAVEWRQPLAAGDNEIPIAIRGERPGRYQLIVIATAGPERIDHEVLLEVTGT